MQFCVISKYICNVYFSYLCNNLTSFHFRENSHFYTCLYLFVYLDFVSFMMELEVPSRVDGKRRNLALVNDLVSWDEDNLSLTIKHTSEWEKP